MKPFDEVSQWLPEAREGSQEALGGALEACRAYLLMIAQRELPSDVQAKGGASDLVQQTFMEAVRDFERFEGGTETELLAWLRRMLLNNLVNFTRDYRDTEKRSVKREVVLNADSSAISRGGGVAADTPSPSGHAIEQEEYLSLHRALIRLPPDYAQVIRLRYEEDKSFEEIGRCMNRTANAVRKLWARAVERLHQELES